MHSHSYEVEGYGKVVVLVNGDWSGEAIVRWNFHPDETSMKFAEAVLPAKLLLELSKQGAVGIVRDQVISALERL
jgi:hypothetical protein